MKLYKVITIKDGNNVDVKKPIYELSEKETINYKLIGSGAGPGLDFCFYLGQKYAKNFWNRLFGFRIRETELSKNMNKAFKRLKLPSKAININVDFYEKKDDAQNKAKANGANESFVVPCDNCGEVIRTITVYPNGENEKHPKSMVKASNEGWICESTTYFFGEDLVDLLKAKNFRELRRRHENMFGFFCIDCGKNYCAKCWEDIKTIYEEGCYDYTMATCPAGHRHEIND